jgi:hypothetical protein
MILGAVRHLWMVSIVAAPSKLLTYLGEVRVTKANIIYTFRTFKQWAEFTGSAHCCATKQCPYSVRNVLVIPFPVAALRHDTVFNQESVEWTYLNQNNMKPLTLSQETRYYLFVHYSPTESKVMMLTQLIHYSFYRDRQH